VTQEQAKAVMHGRGEYRVRGQPGFQWGRYQRVTGGVQRQQHRNGLYQRLEQRGVQHPAMFAFRNADVG
jgi:hypothetical protein